MKPRSFSKIAISSMLVLSAVTFSPAFQAAEVPAQEQAQNASEKESPETKDSTKIESIAPVQPKMYKAIQGSAMGFSYTDLPPHEGLRISFKVHFVGPWDGTGVKGFGPDRFIAKVDNKLHLLDATFNNCHLVFANNIWQSFPDPHQYRQEERDARVSFLYHGGEAASAVSSLGVRWNKSQSMDSSYTFSFIVSHKRKNMNLTFLTKWVEDNSISTYWIENLEVKPIAKLNEPSAKQEEKAWLKFLRSDGHEAQKAWAKVYAAHPEKLIARVRGLMHGDPKRVEFLIEQLGKGKGKIPSRSIMKEVIVDPDNKHAKNTLKKIYYLRELTLTKGLFSTKAGDYAYTPETNTQIRAIRKALVIGWERSLMLEQISLRLSGYLRMINTRESRYLASQLDSEDPEFAKSPLKPFLGTWKDKKSELKITIKDNGTANSTENQSGTWKFSGNELVITWGENDLLRLNLRGGNLVSNANKAQQGKPKQRVFKKEAEE